MRYFGMICLLILSLQANAATTEYVPMQGTKYRWTLGLDVSYAYVPARNDWMYLTYDNRQGTGIYVAYRTLGHLGFEFGYDWTDDKGKNVIVYPGMTLFGATSLVSATYFAKIRLKDTYLDMYWHAPFTMFKRKCEFKFGVGAGWLREGVKTYVGTSTDPLAVALANLQGDTTMVARFNLGFQTLFGPRWGGRALFNFQTSSSAKGKYVLSAPVNQHILGNTYKVLIGVFYNITGYYD